MKFMTYKVFVKKKASLIRRNSNAPPPEKKNQPRFRRQGSCRKWETMVYISKVGKTFLRFTRSYKNESAT